MGSNRAIEGFGRLVGTWDLEVNFPGMEPATAITTFEWVREGVLLLQRWEVPTVPEAPDGVAAFAWDETRGTVLQHYFDTRGVVRLYEAALDDDTWTMERTRPDFSDFNFAQRFTGRFTDDDAIDGTWEIAHDFETFEKDFDGTYRRR